jgi:hypothetical protein
MPLPKRDFLRSQDYPHGAVPGAVTRSGRSNYREREEAAGAPHR